MLENFSDVKEGTIELLDKARDYSIKSGRTERAREFSNRIAVLKTDDMTYNIAIIGFMKRGKSTLLNVLLGQNDTTLAPVKVNVCTATITKYLDVSHHPQGREAAIITFLDGTEREIPYQELPLYVTEKENKENEKSVGSIKVYGRFPLIKSGVSLVDTPGKGSIHREHDALSEGFLPMADAIMLLQSSDLPVEIEERRFLQGLSEREKSKIFVVMTKADNCSEKDLKDSEAFIRSELSSLGIDCSKIYKTSAKVLLDGRKNELPQEELKRLSISSGIEELERDLERHILKNSARAKNINDSLCEALSAMSTFLEEEERGLMEKSQKQKQDLLSIEREKRNLMKAKENLAKTREIQFKKFKSEWERSLNEFLSHLPSLQSRIEVHLINKIEGLSMLELKKYTADLNREIGKAMTDEIAPFIMKLENSLNDVTERYIDDIENTIDIREKGTNKPIYSWSVKDINKSLALSGATLGAGMLATLGVIGLLSGALTGAFGYSPFVGWATGAGNVAMITAVGGAAAAAIGIGTVGIGALIAVKLASSSAKSSLKTQVSEAIEKGLSSLAEETKAKLSAYGDDIFESVRTRIEEEIDVKIRDIDEDLESMESDTPFLQGKTEAMLSQVREINRRCGDLLNEAEAFSCLAK